MKICIMKIVAIASLSAMIGCATSGTNFSLDGVKILTIGKTTESDVISAFGKGFKRQEEENSIDHSVLLTYGHSKGSLFGATGRNLIAEFRNGKLNGYLYFSSFDTDSTDFKTEPVGQAEAKAMTFNEIESLMGHHNGEMQLPSRILRNMGANFRQELVPPPDAASAILYFYSVLSKISSDLP